MSGLSQYQLNVCNNVASFGGILSLFSSMSTVLIIYNMKKVSGYVWLVFHLSLATSCIAIGQIMFTDDTSLLKSNGGHNPLCQASGFLRLYGNIAAGLWILAITVSVACVVFKTVKLNITSNILYITIICNSIPIAIGLAAIFTGEIVFSDTGSCFLPKDLTVVEGFYDVVHYTYFIANIVLYIIIWYNIYKMRRDLKSGNLSIADIASGKFNQVDFRSSIFDFVSSIRNSFRPSMGPAANSETPSTLEAVGKRKLSAVEVLVSRLIWYPLVLIIIEIFRELDRGGKDVSFPLHLLHLLTNSLQGTAYFIIFLSMQPRAFTIFMNLLSCYYIRQGKESSSPSSPPPQSFKVSWANNVEPSTGQLNDNLVTDDSKETTSLMKEMDEDDLVEQVEVNHELIIEVMRSSIAIGPTRVSDMSRASSFLEAGESARESSTIVNAIRIAADSDDINL